MSSARMFPVCEPERFEPHRWVVRLPHHQLSRECPAAKIRLPESFHSAVRADDETLHLRRPLLRRSLLIAKWRFDCVVSVPRQAARVEPEANLNRSPARTTTARQLRVIMKTTLREKMNRTRTWQRRDETGMISPGGGHDKEPASAHKTSRSTTEVPCGRGAHATARGRTSDDACQRSRERARLGHA